MSSTTIIPPLVKAKPTLYKTTDPLLKRLRLEDPYGRPIDTIAKDFEGKELVIFLIGSAYGDGKLVVIRTMDRYRSRRKLASL